MLRCYLQFTKLARLESSKRESKNAIKINANCRKANEISTGIGKKIDIYTVKKCLFHLFNLRIAGKRSCQGKIE